jgi:hypothetical protein
MSGRDEDEQPKRSFKVEDRRRFSDTGEARDGGDAAPEQAQPPPQQEIPREASPPRSDMPPLPMNFSTFVISLSTQALAHLGEIADPVEGRINVDLIGAKQLIDILGMLETKTKGNLDDAEAALLGNCLYDLRLKFVEVSRQPNHPAAK